jgi:hypothetical protein
VLLLENNGVVGSAMAEVRGTVWELRGKDTYGVGSLEATITTVDRKNVCTRDCGNREVCRHKQNVE